MVTAATVPSGPMTSIGSAVRGYGFGQVRVCPESRAGGYTKYPYKTQHGLPARRHYYALSIGKNPNPMRGRDRNRGTHRQSSFLISHRNKGHNFLVDRSRPGMVFEPHDQCARQLLTFGYQKHALTILDLLIEDHAGPQLGC